MNYVQIINIKKMNFSFKRPQDWVEVALRRGRQGPWLYKQEGPGGASAVDGGLRGRWSSLSLSLFFFSLSLSFSFSLSFSLSLSRQGSGRGRQVRSGQKKLDSVAGMFTIHYYNNQ